MSELKKPTIEGLIEKLLEGNHIEENEAGTVQALLEQASNGLNKDEIFTLVTKLNDKLDAHTSDLITPNGLNYSVFESEVKTVAQVINKEKIQREKSQTQATVEPLQEKKDIEKTPQEKAEIERQERIAENKNYLKKLIDSIPGAAELGITEEKLTEIAEIEERNTRYFNEMQDIVNKRDCSYEEAKKIVDQKFEMDQESFSSNESAIAEKSWLKKEIETRTNLGMSQQEALDDIYKNNPIRMKTFEFIKGGANLLKELATGVLDFGVAISTSLYDNFSGLDNNKEDELRAAVEAREGLIRSDIYDGKGIDVRHLKIKIDMLELAKKELAEKRNKIDRKYGNEKKVDRFFERITIMYLSSDSNGTLSKLYEKFKNQPSVKELELDFEDFIIGIRSNLESKGKIVGDNQYIDSMMDAERVIRRADLLRSIVDEAKENGNTILEEEYFQEIDKDVESAKKDILESKTKFAKRRGLKLGADVIKEDKTYKKHFSNVHLESDIVRISNDRKEIIKMSKELGISPEEAAQKYFSENEDNLNLYSKRDRSVLTGRNNANGRNGRFDNVLKKMRSLMKEKNDRLISTCVSEIEALTQKIDEGNKNSVKLSVELIALENAKLRLERLQQRGERLDAKSKAKSAMGVFERKEKKEFEKTIFERYVKSGKTVTDFLKEINSGEKPHSLTKEAMLKIITNGGRKYMLPEEYGTFINNERTIFVVESRINALQRKRDNAITMGNDILAELYDKKIKNEESNKRKLEELTADKRKNILRRMGLNLNENERIEEDTQAPENVQVVDSEETKNSAEIVQEQEGQTVERKSGLAIEQIEVTGVKPNVKAIAKKSKVTPSRIKKVFAKIVGLRKSKEKVAEQNEQETRPEEKTNKASTEAGAR